MTGEPSIEDRLTEIERRLTELEASQYRPALPPTQPAVTFTDFAPNEEVTLVLTHPHGGTERPVGDPVFADGTGRVLFLIGPGEVVPIAPPDNRILRARGQRSGRVSEQAVEPFARW